MKKSIFTFAIFAAVGLSSCTGGLEDAVADAGEQLKDAVEEEMSEPTIVGEWALSDFDMGMEIPAEQKEMFDNMKKEMIANSTMSYKADGTYTQNDKMQGEARTQTGTYSVDGDKLTTTTSDGVETVTNIAKLTDTEASFSIEDRGNTMTMTYTRK